MSIVFHPLFIITQSSQYTIMTKSIKKKDYIFYSLHHVDEDDERIGWTLKKMYYAVGALGPIAATIIVL